MTQLRSASDIGLKDYIHIKKAERAAQPFLCSKTIRQVINAPTQNVPELFLSEKTKDKRLCRPLKDERVYRELEQSAEDILSENSRINGFAVL
ncbi:hypothetical protein DQG23_28825 [Paenibacillus contaminans]|uniref:Uncharacterized protein n=1 Tax=Paenibacillus contaminans TaxID=450362 RepID=A0A329M8Y5_9BACL|nr:hypothetical protein DQG23_28825 [Paenibacillus contaminans]